MHATVDLLDTQLLVYIANEQESWAVDIHEEMLAGKRIAIVPRYVATEFYRVLRRNRGRVGANVAWEHLNTLYDAPGAVSPNPERFRVDVDTIRKHATTRTLAAICEMEAKDAPILAAAHRYAEFVNSYDPPNHGPAGIPDEPEEVRLAGLCGESNADAITLRILTHEDGFVGADLEALGLDDVRVARVPRSEPT
jgi:predicted nucleic acid-binding protein